MIGLVTCYFHPNYGSMLQAYATQKILQEWDISCENICIDGIKKEVDGAKMKFYLRQIYNPQVLTGTILRIAKKKIYITIKRNTLAKCLNKRTRCFNDFKEKQFIVSEEYESKQQLSEKCIKYSAVVVGSDQLWLPSNIDADYYTLSWVPDHIKKVSYSTSFGTDFLPKKQQEAAKQFLSRFEYISVREKTGQRMVREYTNMEVPIVCDPTLLFTAEEWMCIQNEPAIFQESYILCYFLGNNREDREFAKRLRELTGCKIVALLHLDEYIAKDEGYADVTPYDIGPGELLNLIRNATYIVTDSFHGSVFSIIYRKLFFTSERVRTAGLLCTNSRIDNLFEITGITGRKIHGNENVAECMEREIDYDVVHQKLEALRATSKKYLQDALAL